MKTTRMALAMVAVLTVDMVVVVMIVECTGFFELGEFAYNHVALE